MYKTTQAAADVMAERRRQIEDEGWTAEHDDGHTNGSLAQAAACYAYPERIFVGEQVTGRGYEPFTMYRDAWPRSWADHWWKPTNRRRDLVKAGALILAEIERIDRQGETSA